MTVALDHHYIHSTLRLPLPDLGGFSVTKHSKGNSDGVKLERPNHRVIPRGKFDTLDSLDAVLERLFGPLTPTPVTQSP